MSQLRNDIFGNFQEKYDEILLQRCTSLEETTSQVGSFHTSINESCSVHRAQIEDAKVKLNDQSENQEKELQDRTKKVMLMQVKLN